MKLGIQGETVVTRGGARRAELTGSVALGLTRVVSYAVGCLLITNAALAANPQAAPVFGDQMVLQRDATLPIWGTADPGAKVNVTFAGQTREATANEKGAWRVMLAPLETSSEPQELTIAGATGPATILRNVLVGEVWVGSGQSNMAGRVASYARRDETLAALAAREEFPTIRLMQAGPKPTWREAKAESVAAFSALLFAFGERLHRELNVPVGLIVGAVGGTPSGSWIPPATYAESALCQARVAEFASTYDHAAATRQYEAKRAAWKRQADAAQAAGKKPRGRQPTAPKLPGEASRGGKIGGLYQRYIQPVAGFRIRGVLWDQGEARSGIVGVDQYTLMSELIRGWREAWGQRALPFVFVQKPSGGGSAFSDDDPITRNADPFVKNLPDIRRLGDRGGADRHLYVRLMRDTDGAHMVPASDLGSGIHPTNKWGYGNRGAEVALSEVYETGFQAYGPTYRSHRVESSAENRAHVVITFNHVGQGLVAAHEAPLQGFALAGEDGVWHWAVAEIEGETVVLSSANVPAPQRIRYGYAQNRAWANLFNRNGRPALCFDTGE